MKKVFEIYDKAQEVILSVLGFSLFIAILIGIFSRQFAWRIQWADEASRFIMIYAVMIGTAIAYRSGRHIAVGLISESIPELYQTILKLGVHISVVVIGIIMIHSGTLLVSSQGHILAPSLRVPLAFAYSAIPVGGILLSIEGVRMTISVIRGGRKIC
ncbi:TRAP transporter small permease [Pelagibacterium sp.]|uniref:TRAP transporter small permease n=1 Tax=Pelagibacterium sp. TaxID=1967288 RepID=UPI003C7D0B2F